MSLDNRRVLYISYNGMLDPLGQSQVIPYLKGLSGRGVKFTLLSFERAQAYSAEGQSRCQLLRDELSPFGIEWHYLRYHQKPSIPATAYDVISGIRLGRRLVRVNQIEMVHARAHIPAVIALSLKRKLGVKMIFDVRGLMAEEYVDAGHWQAGSIAARMTKAMEARVLGTTEGIVTLTDALWNTMKNWPSLSGRTIAHEVIPCCVDQEQFRFDDTVRAAKRKELGLDERLVLVYSGSVGGWYMTNEMAQFFAELKQRRPNAFFLWLTNGNREIVDRAMARSGIQTNDYVVCAVSSHEVASYLNAADIGIAFYKRGISRLGTSPVKVSEYLSCALPVIVNAGIGDTDELLKGRNVGVVVPDFTQRHYAEAVDSIVELTTNGAELRQRTRAAAEKLFDLDAGVTRYASLYEEVFARSS
jgi:glycosyltransferase involved in cell wall biosynthesis